MSDAPLPEIEDERYDYAHLRPRGILRKRTEGPEKPGNGLAISVAVGSLLLQILAIAWTGGRLEERVTRHDKQLDGQAQDIKELNQTLSKQASVLSATNATYAEILRRLDSIDGRFDRVESKLDDRNGT